jgi:hypothetical protein
MKTGKAVLVSVGIIAAVLAVAGGVGYFVYYKIDSRDKRAAAQVEAEAAREEADRSAPQCGSHDDDERAKAVLAPIEPALQNTQRPVARIKRVYGRDHAVKVVNAAIADYAAAFLGIDSAG